MSDPLAVADGLSVRFGPSRLLDRVDLRIHPGDELALVGRSGSGKSTLLLTLAGLIAPSAGSVRWPGLASRPADRRAQIGVVFQAPSLLPELTAAQNVQLPLRLRGQGVPAADSACRAALEAVDAGDLADALPAQLSGGQQQRVAVARVLAGRHPLVLADEPTGSLDRSHAYEVVQVLRAGVAAGGGSLLLATHDLDLVTLFDDQLSIVDGTLTARRRAGAVA